MRNALWIGLALVTVTATPAWARCSHPYFPTNVGNEWVYEDSSKNETSMRVTKNEGNEVELASTMKDLKEPGKDVESTFSASCDKNGMQINFGEMFATVQGRSGMGMKVSADDVKGVSFPPASKLKKGESWKQTRTMRMGTSENPNAIQMEMEIENTVVGTEKVEVPAGKFNAIKIKFTSETRMHMPGMPAMPNSPGSMSGSGYIWIAKGVGVVKHTDTSRTGAGQRGDSTTELKKLKLVK